MSKPQSDGSEITDVLENIKNFISGDNNNSDTNLPNDNNDVLELTEVFQDDGSIVDITKNRNQKNILQEIDNVIGDVNMPRNKKDKPIAEDSLPEDEKRGVGAKKSLHSSVKNRKETQNNVKENRNDDDVIIDGGNPQKDSDTENDLVSKNNVNKIHDLINEAKQSQQTQQLNMNNNAFVDVTIRDLVISTLTPILKNWVNENLTCYSTTSRRE